MSEERPEALLKSALEKIVYFEARSTQLGNDLASAQREGERLKVDLASASQREIDLRRVVAELEVRTTRAHGEREEAARVAEALRRERAELIGKMLEASRISGAGQQTNFDDFDLASFIAELRSEVLVRREDGRAAAVHVEAGVPAPVATPSRSDEAPATSPSVTSMAVELRQQGRLQVTGRDLDSLGPAGAFAGRSEETLFGFSVRELSAPDASARARAADRLRALAHPAAAPALAAALHSETAPVALVAMLAALSSLAKVEALPVVTPHLTSPSSEVRIAALKALLALDPTQAAPHLAAAIRDPDRAVRRRASLLALGLGGGEALKLGEQAIRDADADVRALAALVLGASGAEVARPMLLTAMRDVEVRVRRAAGQAISRLLGRDVTALVELDDAQRRREVRRLANAPSNPVLASRVAPPPVVKAVARPTVKVEQAVRPQRAQELPQAPSAVRPASVVAPAAARAPSRVAVAVLEVAPAPAPRLTDAVVRELRASIRGRPLDELAAGVGATPEDTVRACTALMAGGQVVRRGLKYFVA